MKLESKYTWIFLLSVAVLLLGNGLILLKQVDSEWMTYQKQYFKLAAEKTDDARIKSALEGRLPKIEQLIIKDFGHGETVDRCLTCHMAMDDPRFADAEHPFKTHPEIPGKHPLREFGCTICHDGNGRGLTAYDAHGKKKHWVEPMLTGEYIESACARCHPAPYLEETPHLRQGAELFMSQACYGCHKIEGVSDGRLGVELTEVGHEWPIPYLVESIKDPKANNIDSIMPNMRLSDSEIKALVIYLKSLTGENYARGAVPAIVEKRKWEEREPPVVPVTYESGEKLFIEKACNACHAIADEGGDIAPDLSSVGLQRSEEWIIHHFIDPRALVAGSIMPDFTLSETEMAALTLFLTQQKKMGMDF